MTETPRLPPCGHSADRILELAAEVTDDPPGRADAAEVVSCPHCSAELIKLRSRWAQVRRAAVNPVRVPPGLVSRVLSAVRTVRGGAGGRHIEVVQVGGVVRIPESTVLVLVRRLAREVVEVLPGVRFRGLVGDGDGVQVLVAVPYGVVLADAASRVRRALRSELDLVLGAAAPAVDVIVEDILEDIAGTDRNGWTAAAPRPFG